MIARVDVEAGHLAEDPLLRHLRPGRIDLERPAPARCALAVRSSARSAAAKPISAATMAAAFHVPFMSRPPEVAVTLLLLHYTLLPRMRHACDFLDRDSLTRRPRQHRRAAPDPVKTLVERLDLEKYKATVKGLTQFGDRRQGTDRNRAAVDWIEAQLKSYGCPTERVKYVYDPPPPAAGGRGRGNTGLAVGGGRPRGDKIPTGVNTDPMKQPDEKLRALNMQPTTPGPREMVFCTKVGTTHPDEMYIVGGHMDGHGWGEAANDDGSGTALVMELARVFSAPDVKTERTIRFALWNNEETGSQAARAYVEQRQALQGKENPAGSGKYPEPKWLGMIQHDMMMFDHGMPLPDGTMRKEQRAEADVNIEFQSNSKMAAEQPEAGLDARGRQREIRDRLSGRGRPAHDQHRLAVRSWTSSPAISVRENERGVADRQRLGSAVAPADRRLRHLHRQGFPARPERGADDARRGRGTDGRDAGASDPVAGSRAPPRCSCTRARPTRTTSTTTFTSTTPHDPEQRLHPQPRQHPAVLHQRRDVQRAAGQPELPAAGDHDAGARLLAGRRPRPVHVSRHQLHAVPGAVRAADGALPAADGSRASGRATTAGSRCWRRRGTRCIPANAETVNYIIARSEILSTLGVVLALLLFVARRRGAALPPLSDSRGAGRARQGDRRRCSRRCCFSTSRCSNASCRCASCSGRATIAAVLRATWPAFLRLRRDRRARHAAGDDLHARRDLALALPADAAVRDPALRREPVPAAAPERGHAMAAGRRIRSTCA